MTTIGEGNEFTSQGQEQVEEEQLVNTNNKYNATSCVTPLSLSSCGECEYQMGDHIYQWCSFIGIPAVFQHHGIVLDCYWKDTKTRTRQHSDTNICQISKDSVIDDDDDDEDDEGEWVLQIADFSNIDHHYQELGQREQSIDTTIPDTTDFRNSAPNEQSSSTKRSFGISPSKTAYSVRTYEVSVPSVSSFKTKKKKSKKKNTKKQGNDGGKWHKVLYNANWWQRQMYRTGTCTSASSDPPGLVRARVQFLIDHPELLPKYDAITANCECVAVWCKTGTWATLQAINWLIMTAAGQVKSAVTIGSVVAATNVTTVVPASGFWGWMGYTTTTTVPLIATQPYLIPAIVGYGCITVAAPTVWLLHAKHHAKRTTETLNTSFWEEAIDKPEVFVECITNWSTLHAPQRRAQEGCDEIITYESHADNNASETNVYVIDNVTDSKHDDFVETNQQTTHPMGSATPTVTEQSTGQQSLEES